MRETPSASVLRLLLRNLEERMGPAGGVLVMGDPDLGATASRLPFAQKEAQALEAVKKALESGTSVRAVALEEEAYEAYVKPLQLITDKPVLYVCNVDEQAATTGNAHVDRVREAVAGENAEVLVLAVAVLLPVKQTM